VRWAGVDVGGGRKGFHAVMVDSKRVVDGPEQIRSAVEVVAWLAGRESALTAIDSPHSPAPAGQRSRPCEREFFAAGICGIRYTPDRTTIEARRDGYYEWIQRGFDLYEALFAENLEVIECFPTASWTRWAGSKGVRTRASWTREALGQIELAGVPERTNQDVRDAVAAALTARAHAAGCTESFGDLVVPRLQSKT
jgi:predicted nuclease with RNAse H fold